MVTPRKRAICTWKRPHWEGPGVPVPRVLFAAAAFHLFALGCQNNVEITQIVKQLQSPILGHWEGAFFLQTNSRSPPLREMTCYMSIINSLRFGLSYSLLFQKQKLFTLMRPVTFVTTQQCVRNLVLKLKILTAGRRLPLKMASGT